MTSESKGRTGRFYVSYEEDSGLFSAMAEGSDSVLRRAAVSRSLQGLLRECEELGLEHLEGLTDSAIERIYRWMTVERPAIDYVAGLWGGSSSTVQGPGERPLGFATSQRETKHD